MTTMTPMPVYQSHKKVWALKIAAIAPASPPTIAELEKILNGEITGEEEIVGAWIAPVEKGYTEFPVSREFMFKHKPEVGGYFVQYADGYKSFSPAKAFEEGYTRL